MSRLGSFAHGVGGEQLLDAVACCSSGKRKGIADMRMLGLGLLTQNQLYCPLVVS